MVQRREKVWRSHGEQCDQFGVGSVMVWGGLSMEARQWHSECHQVSGWNPWTHCQTLRWCSGSWVPPGARQCPASCAKSMLGVPGGRRNWYHSMVPMLAWPKSNRTHLGHYVLGPSDADSLHLRLSRISVMPWFTSGRKYPGAPSVISLRACPIVRHAYKHVGAYWGPNSAILSCCNYISAKLSCCIIFFI